MRLPAGSLAVVSAMLACGQTPSPPPTAVTLPPVGTTVASAPIASAAAPAASCSAASSYVPVPAWSGRTPDIPAPPTLPAISSRAGNAYSVAGAVHDLRSLLHHDEIQAAPVTVAGYVVDTNIPRAPACAIHRTGKADPPRCEAEIPSFWMADDKAPAPDAPRIRVVGWARNFAVVYDAMRYYGRGDGATGGKPMIDDILNVDVPYPLPAIGMKLKVTGRYRPTIYVVAEPVSEPLMGVLQFGQMELLEPPPKPARFAR